MRVGIGLSHKETQSLRLAQTIRLSQAARLAVLDEVMSLRIELIHAVRGMRYSPLAHCPACLHELSVGEILTGFTTDPQDFTTKCPKCKQRFAPNLRWSDQHASVLLPFYCPEQTLFALQGQQNFSPEEFKNTSQAVYHSAITHFGSLTAAFLRLGIAYRFDENLNAKDQAKRYLGLLPDGVVAACAGLKLSVVRAMRKAAGIPGFSKARLADALGY